MADTKPRLGATVPVLRSFDEAAISTIHGFCQRLLNEYALEAGGYDNITVILVDFAF